MKDDKVQASCGRERGKYIPYCTTYATWLAERPVATLLLFQQQVLHSLHESAVPLGFAAYFIVGAHYLCSGLERLLTACRAPCVDLRYCEAASTLYSMHDDTFKMASPAQRNILQVQPSCRSYHACSTLPWPNPWLPGSRSCLQLCLMRWACLNSCRSCMQVVDVEKQAFIARATEFSEQCELLCFSPVGESAGDWGNELIAGAVHGSESPTDNMLPFPYFHQSFLQSRFVQSMCRPETEQATSRRGAVCGMHLKLSIGNCLAELRSSGCRFLPDMLPHWPAIPLLPQGHNSHSCPVRV